jgi:hypothetical protein
MAQREGGGLGSVASVATVASVAYELPPHGVGRASLLRGQHVRAEIQRHEAHQLFQLVNQEGLVHHVVLPVSVAAQYFLTRIDVTQVNLSQNGRLKGRNGRRTSR